MPCTLVTQNLSQSDSYDVIPSQRHTWYKKSTTCPIFIIKKSFAKNRKSKALSVRKKITSRLAFQLGWKIVDKSLATLCSVKNWLPLNGRGFLLRDDILMMSVCCVESYLLIFSAVFHCHKKKTEIRRGKKNYLVLVRARITFEQRITTFFYL